MKKNNPIKNGPKIRADISPKRKHSSREAHKRPPGTGGHRGNTSPGLARRPEQDRQTRVGEDVEKLEPRPPAGRKVKSRSLPGREFGIPQKVEQLSCDPAIRLLGT